MMDEYRDEDLERDEYIADANYEYTLDQKMVAELKQDIGSNPYQE